MVVNFARKHWAAPGVTVTESKFLRDARLGIDREVDIVVEGSFDGEPVVTSIEVIEHGRPADIAWAEREIAKHRHLPTNRLVLVSKSGFAKTALAAVTAEGGWVSAVRPERVEVDGQQVIKSLFMDLIQLKPTACWLHVLDPGKGQLLTVAALPDNSIYDADGRELGSALELVTEVLGLRWLRESFAWDAHGHPERDALKSLSCGVTVGALGYHLRAEPAGELHAIAAIEIEGEFGFAQHELAFAVADLGGRRYGSAEASVLSRPTVWVATTDQDADKTTISWRTTDGKPLTEPPSAPVRAPQFPGLLELPVPPDPGPAPDDNDEQAAAVLSVRHRHQGSGVFRSYPVCATCD